MGHIEGVVIDVIGVILLHNISGQHMSALFLPQTVCDNGFDNCICRELNIGDCVHANVPSHIRVYRRVSQDQDFH